MIGNRADAIEALTRYAEDEVIGLIGRGCTRSAYLIDGVVYKVEHQVGRGANDEEYGNIAKAISSKFSFPMTNMFLINNEYVLAMQYIDGVLTGECDNYYHDDECDCDFPCLTSEEMDELRRMTLTDTSWSNFIRGNDGKTYVIDFVY